MSISKKILKMVIVIVMISLLVGCGPSETPLPTPDHSILASDKRKDAPDQNFVVYTLPEMDQITLANSEYKEGLTMDIYYPLDFGFTKNLPVVIFVNGFGDAEFQNMFGCKLKDSGVYISWGQLVAASGMIAITYESHDPDIDIHDLLNFTLANGSYLRVDRDRICLWSSSASSPTALSALTDTSADYHDSLACAVIYYGLIPPASADNLAADIPLFIVKAGKDVAPLNIKLDQFVEKAREVNIPLEFVNYEDGIHGFDALQDTDESREIIKQTLEFIKAHLQE